MSYLGVSITSHLKGLSKEREGGKQECVENMERKWIRDRGRKKGKGKRENHHRGPDYRGPDCKGRNRQSE